MEGERNCRSCPIKEACQNSSSELMEWAKKELEKYPLTLDEIVGL